MSSQILAPRLALMPGGCVLRVVQISCGRQGTCSSVQAASHSHITGLSGIRSIGLPTFIK
jgi:hypothetical protein